MAQYDVILFPAARGDLMDVWDDLGALPSEQSERFLDSLVEAAEQLRASPEVHPLARDVQFRLRGYRVLRLGDYLVFYSIIGKTVELRRMFFARRQYEGLVT